MIQTGTEGLALFEQPPTAPPARHAEQRALPMPEVSIEARYQAWRETDDGARVWQAIQRAAGELVATGATRLSAKGLVERVRAELRVPINNDFTAHLGRDLDAIPAFSGLVELRKRTAL